MPDIFAQRSDGGAVARSSARIWTGRLTTLYRCPMARKITTTVIDDIDGSTDAQSVTFGLQGTAYSIDLGAKNLEKLTKALAPFIATATRHRSTTSTTPSRAVERGYDLVQLREWAGRSKIALPKRGRIPAAIVTQYQAAGGR